MKRTILIYIHNFSRIQEMMILYNILKNEYIVEILIESNVVFIDKLKEHNASFIILKPNTRIINKIINNKVIRKIKQTSIGQYIHQKIFEKRFKIEYKYIEKLFIKKAYDLLITYSDRHLNTMEYALMKYTKEIKIKILLPYLVYTSPDGFLVAVKGNENYTLCKNSSYYKKNVYNKFNHLKYKDYHVYQPFFYMFLHKEGILSSNPWVFGAGLASKTLVCNKTVYAEYKSRNFDGDYEIVGDLSYIKILESIKNSNFRKNFVKHHNLLFEKNIIYSIPPYSFLGLLEHQIFLERVERDILSLLKLGNEYNIILSLHPSLEFSDYKYLEEKYDIYIVTEELSTFLCIADLYVAYPSSTIIWSILLGIKTLMLSDVVKVNLYRDFKTPVFLTKFRTIDKMLMYMLNHYSPDFTHDWELLSKEDCFHNNLEKDYCNIIKRMLIQNN